MNETEPITARFAEMTFVVRVHELAAEGWSDEEIADALRSSPDKVHSGIRLWWARERLVSARAAYDRELLAFRGRER